MSKVPAADKAETKARNATLPYDNPESWQPDWTVEDLMDWAREHGVPLYGEDS